MTVGVDDELRIREYPGDDTATPRAYGFRILDVDDLRVTRVEANGSETVLVRGTDYTVSGAGNPTGGDVTPLAPIVTGTIWRIEGDMALDQPTDYTAGDEFPAESHERGLDRSMIAHQEARRDLNDTAARSWLVPRGETGGTLPAQADRVGKYQAWDADGKPVAASGTGADGDLRGDLGENADAGGAALVGYKGRSVAATFGILEVVQRPAMEGIFSSAADQRAALLAFISKAAAGGKVIEWGALDVSLDVVTQTNGLRGLTVPSGSHWIFHPDTRIRALPNSANIYEILNIWDQQDIHIEGCGGKIIGDRDDHTGVTGEWGMGVSIRGSSRVTIRDLGVEDCWGDGYYIGSTANQAWSEDILLENPSTLRARRNGLSLVSAKRFTCVRGHFADTNGTAPQWGIDIEPNSASEFLEDILFVHPRTSDSASHGFGIYLNAMEGTSNRVSIRIIGPRDDGSLSAFAPGRAVNIPGDVVSVEPVLTGSNGPAILFRGKAASGPHYKIVRPLITNWNRAGSVSSNLSAAILVYAETTDTGTYALGGVDIIEPDLKLTSGAAVTAISSVDSRTTTPDPMQDVQIVRPLDLQGLPCVTSGVKRFSDPLRKSVRTLPTGSTSIGLTSAAVHYVTPTLAVAATYTITATHSIGREIVFEVGGADGNEARLQFPVGEALFPDTLGGNNRIYATAKGARIRVRKQSATEWFVVEKIGAWTAA